MKAEAVEKLLQSLGCEKIKRADGKVISTCPFAPWKHSGGRDKQPSFAVFVRSDDVSGANCYGVRCNFHGSLSDLIFRLQKVSGKDLSEQLLYVSENNHADLKKRLDRLDSSGGIYADRPAREPIVWTGGKDYSDPVVLAKAHPALPESDNVRVDEMISLLNEDVIDYLKGPKRRFNDQSIADWKLGWHPGARRISVPQYDHINRLVNISGRLLAKTNFFGDVVDRRPKWMHAKGFKRDLYLFGEDKFDLSADGKGTLFVVEGAFDVIYLHQCGIPNVGAINGSYINKSQIEKIVRWFDRVVLVMDGDAAGVEASQRLMTRLSARLHVDQYCVSDDRDPNEMTDDEIADLKVRFLG